MQATAKLLKGYIEDLCDIKPSEEFLGVIPKTQSIKEKANVKLDFIIV